MQTKHKTFWASYLVICVVALYLVIQFVRTLEATLNGYVRYEQEQDMETVVYDYSNEVYELAQLAPSEYKRVFGDRP